MPKQPSDEEIRNRAYELFLERGGTPGSELEDWARAEEELKARFGTEGLSMPKGLEADVSDAPESGTRRDGNDATPTPPARAGGGGGGKKRPPQNRASK